MLRSYGLLHVPDGRYEDEALLDHGYGITDIVKRPNPFGKEPAAEGYAAGKERILRMISELRPQVVVFTYLGALRNMLGLAAHYGFNPAIEDYVRAKVFVCPLPGVGGQSKADIHACWQDLQRFVLFGATLEAKS